MADVNGLVSDPDFQKLDPASQRQALAGVSGDQSFAQLSDDDTQQFLARMTPQTNKTQQTLSQVSPQGRTPSLPQPQFSRATSKGIFPFAQDASDAYMKSP